METTSWRASAGQLPLFYNTSSRFRARVHANFKTRSPTPRRSSPANHAVPITIDEFVAAQRFYPIVFSVGDNPVPLALMGLNEGVNVFVDDEGKLLGETYVPAYIRRYPFMLARSARRGRAVALLRSESGLVGDFEEGKPLFETASRARPPTRSSNSARSSSFRRSAPTPS
jgi:hypothetical protein